jgi:hypothetical protein
VAKILGVEGLIAKLRQKAATARKNAAASVVVGFSQSYALPVHENLEAYHPVGQAKFLEQPARQLRPVFADIIKRAVTAGKTMSQALLLAGLRLQREAMLLTPVDTGALRASAFTRLE